VPPPQDRPARRPQLPRKLTAALLPLALVAPMTVGASASSVMATPGGGWSSRWMGDASEVKGTSLADVRSIIGASGGSAGRLTGAGVGVALLDTGVAPVPGLPPAQIVNGPDLSFESQAPQLRYLDTYGHGTHLAGIVVGNDAATGTVGLAPQAKLTSIKLGTANGAVDVSQVIAAIDWVVQNRNHDRANPIRVLNLAYGSGGNPAAYMDPLHYAVERAWDAGIVVVAAAGNDGNLTSELTNPATDPYVVSVGASSTKGTIDTRDDELSTYTNLGNRSMRQPDVLAPGESIVSLRDPGSSVDESFPGARADDTLFRGSGTSQAAAVTSAAIALLLQARPSLTPNQVKQIIKCGTPLTKGKAAKMGLRELNLAAALTSSANTPPQFNRQSTGMGSLDATRGASRVVVNGVELSGNKTIFGTFNNMSYVSSAAAGRTWRGGEWMGTQMAGDGWTGSSFASKTWGSAVWPGSPWGGSASWQDPAWLGRFWAGRFWAATGWSGRFWASEDWSTAVWE
jgi:serine protease AprX